MKNADFVRMVIKDLQVVNKIQIHFHVRQYKCVFVCEYFDSL